MDLNIKHTIEPVKIDDTGLREVISSLAQQLEKLSSAFNSDGKADTNTTRVNLDNKNTQDKAASPSGLYTGGSPNTQMGALLNKLDSLISKMNKNADYDAGRNPSKNAYNEERARLEARRRHADENAAPTTEPSNRMWRNYAKSMLLGGATMAVYQGNAFGATSGRAMGAINTGAGGYLGFQRSLYNEQISNQQSLGSTAITSLSLAGGAAFGLPGALIGGAAGFIGNYILSKSAAEDKAQNELALNADFDSWRFQNFGISKASDTSFTMDKNIFGGGGKSFAITKLQQELYKPENAPFAHDAGSVIFGARFDTLNHSAGNEAAAAAYNTQLQKGAMLIGSDPTALSKATSNYAAFTGMTLNDSLKKLIEINEKYGGDQVANTAKMIQIMSSTPISGPDATNMVEKYQYNDAMLQNQIGNATTTPMNKFIKQIYMQIAGASHDEIMSGEFSGKHLSEYYRAQRSTDPMVLTNPKYVAMELAYGRSGMSLLASNRGVMESGNLTGGPVQGAPDLPAAFTGFAKMAAEALSGISTINAQSVSVYTNGIEDGSYTKGAPDRMNYHYNPESGTKGLYVVHHIQTGVGEAGVH